MDPSPPRLLREPIRPGSGEQLDDPTEFSPPLALAVPMVVLGLQTATKGGGVGGSGGITG